MVRKVHVVATTFEGTRAALQAAVPLARGLDADLGVVVPRLVSCAAELDVPTPAADLIAKRYRDLARAIGADAEVDAFPSVGINDLLAHICAAGGPVAVGGPVGRCPPAHKELVEPGPARGGWQVLCEVAAANPTQRLGALGD